MSFGKGHSVSPHLLDFRLTVTGLNNGADYSVSLDDCVTGANIGLVSAVPFDRSRLPLKSLHLLRRYAEKRLPEELLFEVGTSLANLLLPGRIADVLLAKILQHPTAPVSLRLNIQHRDLATLPWEFLRLDAARALEPNGWLFLNARLTLRRESHPLKEILPIPKDDIRVLLAWADPCTSRFPPLMNLDAEVLAVQTTLRQCGISKGNIHLLADANCKSLEEEIQKRKPHLLHFIGHGENGLTDGRLILIGSERSGKAILLGETLAEWLKDSPIRLVILAACDSSGVARSLAQAGIPAVVSMQLPLRDDVTALLARSFYLALLQPLPVESALAQARLALSGTGPGWGVATLTTCATDGNLFVPSARFTVPYPRNKNFVGHQSVLEEMHHCLVGPDPSPVVLLGMGGLGKTQLASEYAHCYRDYYPGGVYWIKAGSNKSVLEEMWRIGELCSVPMKDNVDAADARSVQHVLQQCTEPTLLIYDNVTWENEGQHEDEEPPELYLPVTGACRILVTTRHGALNAHLTASKACIFDDQQLTLVSSEALCLLTGNRELPASEIEAAMEIIETVGSLPLALVLACDYVLRHRIKYAKYLTYLKSNPKDLLYNAVFKAISLSYHALKPGPQHLLALLACFDRQGIPCDLAFQASGCHSEMDFGHDLYALTECSLLSHEEEDNRLTMHELVRVFALGEHESDRVRSAANAVAGLLAEQLKAANATMDWNRMRRELPHCRAVSKVCRLFGSDPLYIALLLAHAEYLLEHRELTAAGEGCEEGIALTDHDANSKLTNAHFWRLRSEVHMTQEETPSPYTMECVEKALRIALATLPDDDPELWHFYNSKGLVLKMAGCTEEALDCYQMALYLCRRADGDRREAIALITHNIAALYEKKGMYDQALWFYREAMQLLEEIYGSEHSKIAVRLNSIGRVHFALGDYEEALVHHKRAHAIHSKTYPPGDMNVLMSLYYIAICLLKLSQPEDAKLTYDEAMSGLRDRLGSEHAFYKQLQDNWQRLSDSPAGENDNAPD